MPKKTKKVVTKGGFMKGKTLGQANWESPELLEACIKTEEDFRGKLKFKLYNQASLIYGRASDPDFLTIFTFHLGLPIFIWASLIFISASQNS